MRKLALMVATAAIASAPVLMALPASAAGVDVHLGDRHEDHGGIVVEGRAHHPHCHTVTTVVHRHGRTVRTTERRCD